MVNDKPHERRPKPYKDKEDRAASGDSDKEFTEVIKIMANTPPISNEEIVKRSKKRKS